MKLSNLKTWLPGMILGLSLLAAVPVSADNLHSENPPPEQFERLSSTNDLTANAASQNSDDSGNVYNFKDSKTSGVVIVTKTWEDSLSNEERPVPDVSISTSKPGKNPLGYTITYHANGLTFLDGSTENEIIVNSSGKIVSGQYKELSGSSGWYSDSDCTNKIELDSEGLPLNDVTFDLELYARPKTFVLKIGSDFNNLIPSTATSVVFTDKTKPASATLIDVDADGDGSVVAWMDETTMFVSSQESNQRIIASADCSSMFALRTTKISSIDFSNLDTQDVTNMSYMFSCYSLTSLDLSPLNTQNVTNMSSMFHGCSGLTALDLTPLNTQNVTNMGSMFCGCSGLTALDLTPLDTQKVTNMSSMFDGCSGLTTLDLSPLDTNSVTDMSYMFYQCYGLKNLDMSHLDTRNVTVMNSMFSQCIGLVAIDLSSLDTGKVTTMKSMFRGCRGLTTLDLSPLDTSNVTNMGYMFRDCSSLTALNLSSMNTQKVTEMAWIFKDCSKLINLSLGDRFAFVGSEYNLPEGTWYASDGTAYASNGSTCTIPNNKADTYTRK